MRTQTIHTISLSLTILVVGVSVAINGCGHQSPAPSDDPLAIPFDLVLPSGTISGGNYYAIAGTKGEEQISQVGDSLVEVTVWRFYAQFISTDNEPIDFNVFINNSKLSRHRDTDTLRLRSAFDTTVTHGEQIWHLREFDEDRFDIGRFILPSVSLLDTIGPFHGLHETQGTIRSDTALTIRWQPGASGGNIRIEWVTQENRIVRDALDFAGSFVIPAAVMENLRGTGTVIVTRTRSITDNVNGKTVIGVRMSQRTYEVEVE